MPSDEQGLQRALCDLERLGVIRGNAQLPAENDESENGVVQWIFSGAVPPDFELAQRDGGDSQDGEGGGPPSSNDLPSGGGDDEGGAGLGQVLAHPVLFSFAESE